MEQQPSQEQERSFQLSDVWAIVQMQWRVVAACTAVGFGLAVLYVLVAPPGYTARTTLMLSPMSGQEIKTDRVLDLDQYQRWNRHMFTQTQLEIIYGRHLREDVLLQYNELGHTDLRPDEDGLVALRNMMQADPKVGTELVDITVVARDAEKAALLANLIAETYQRRNLDALRDAARGAKEWVEQQEREWTARIDEANRELLAFLAEHKMADVEQQITALSARQGSLAEARAEVLTELALRESTANTYESMLAQGRYSEIAKQLDSEVAKLLFQEHARLVTEEARLRQRYADRHKSIESLTAERRRIEDELESEVRRMLGAERARVQLLRDRAETLQSELGLADDELLSMQRDKAQYEKLRMELERAREFYRQLGTRRGELELQAETQLNNVHVVERARVPSKASEPKVVLSLAFGLVGGLALGLGVGLVREMLDDTITSPLDVATWLRVPFLGMIPKIESTTDDMAPELYTHAHPSSSVAEAVRAIRTVLELNPSGELPRRLMVTSAVSGEGKTSTLVRLGIAFANLDRRVLLIDADLRRPRLHSIFGVSRDLGLTTALTGGSLDACIEATSIPNLHVMPAGRSAERPNELLASMRLQATLADLDRRYDLILLDSPPAGLLSDAQILSRHADGVVVIVREQTASRTLIRSAITGLQQVGGQVLGVVLNAVDLNHRRANLRYFYGYAYPYYAHEDDREGGAAAK